jgi:hypothetical protein
MPNEIAVIENRGGAAAPFALIPLGEMHEMAKLVAASGFFGQMRPEQAVVLMLTAQAEGLHPVDAMRRYHIIQGRPAMRSDAMLAEFQRRGGRVVWHERSDSVVSATFSHPSGGEVPVKWTLEDAKRAGLLGKQGGNWGNYPRQMLSARVISEGVRTCLPGVVVGIYTPEEAESFEALPPSPAVATEQQQQQRRPQRDTYTSASPVPEAAPAPPRKGPNLREQFDAVALQHGITFDSAKERGKLINVLLSRAADSRESLTPEDWESAIFLLPLSVEKPAAQPEEPIEADGLTDPFAEDAPQPALMEVPTPQEPAVMHAIAGGM